MTSQTTPAERRVADGVATLRDYIAVGNPHDIVTEILGEEYGGGDARRSAVANRICIALRQCGKLSV
jgi:hypothetical protein